MHLLFQEIVFALCFVGFALSSCKDKSRKGLRREGKELDRLKIWFDFGRLKLGDSYLGGGVGLSVYFTERLWTKF